MEEAYTQEALEAEEREKQLRDRLAVAEEKVLSQSTAVETARYTLNIQFDFIQNFICIFTCLKLHVMNFIKYFQCTSQPEPGVTAAAVTCSNRTEGCCIVTAG